MEKELKENVETTVNDTSNEEKKDEKKSKKGLVIGLIVAGSLVFLALIALLIIMVIKKPKPIIKPVVEPKPTEKITITFDADGGLDVEKITYEKGTKIQLKQSTKDGFSFAGWFDGEKQYTDDDTPTIEKDITLKAHWEELKVDEKLMKIVFDSKGGNKVSSINIKCTGNSATITGLPTPKKDSYNFMSWADKNGTPILNGALLICTDTLYLYANWEKVEAPATPTPAPTPTPAKEKTYKCPEGYELKDTNKCVKLASANIEKYCDSGWTLTRDQSYCAKSSSNINGTRTCPYKSWNGYSGTGTYYEAGRGYCGYFELSSYIGRRQDCINAGGTFASNNHCYRYTDINYEVTCASDERRFEAQAVAPGSNPGCYKATTPKTNKTCPAGYTSYSTYGECAIVIDATLE